MPKYWYEDWPHNDPFYFEVILTCPNCGLSHVWKYAKDVPETFICRDCRRTVTPHADG